MPVKQVGSLQRLAQEEEVSVAVLIQQIVGYVMCDMCTEQGNSERLVQPIVDVEVWSDHFLSISSCPA